MKCKKKTRTWKVYLWKNFFTGYFLRPLDLMLNKSVTDFRKKADIFNSFFFFAKSAQLLKIAVFSLNPIILLPINACQILNSRRLILNTSSVNLIRTKLMIMAWSVFVCWKCRTTLQLNLFFKIFRNSWTCRTFPDDWKKGNIVSKCQNDNKQKIKSSSSSFLTYYNTCDNIGISGFRT